LIKRPVALPAFGHTFDLFQIFLDVVPRVQLLGTTQQRLSLIIFAISHQQLGMTNLGISLE